jgi:hypothetical protein
MGCLSCCDGKYMYMGFVFQRSHPQKKSWGKNGAFLPTSTLMAMWREKGWTTWDIYIFIYTVGVGMMMPGQLPKNNHILLTNLLPFLLRKITTMPYLPAWWASFNKWTEWYTSLTLLTVCVWERFSAPFIYREVDAGGWWNDKLAGDASLQWSSRVKMLWNKVWVAIL